MPSPTPAPSLIPVPLPSPNASATPMPSPTPTMSPYPNPTQTPAPNVDAFELGKAIFASDRCVVCHEDNGDGTFSGTPFDSRNLRYPKSGQYSAESISAIAQYIEDSMPLVDPTQCQGECAHHVASYLWHFIESPTPPTAPPSPPPDNEPLDTSRGDKTHGSLIYEQQCQSCHGVDGNGGVVSKPLVAESGCSTCASFANLVTKIHESMPTPGACAGQCARDVATYIFDEFRAAAPIACDGPIDPGPSPLRRLNKREYINTVIDIFDVERPLLAGIIAEPASGFDTDVAALGISGGNVEAYRSTAEKVAALFAREAVSHFEPQTEVEPDQCDTTAQCRNTFGNTATDCVNSAATNSFCQCGGQRCDTVFPTAPAETGTRSPFSSCSALDAECAYEFIHDYGLKVYRRPLDADESLSLMTIFDVGYSIDFEAGIQLTVEAMLQSPAFIYRLEMSQNDASSNNIVALDSWEIATRLSYMFWASTPDDTLLSLAQSGALTDREVVRTQAERLLADNKAKPVIRQFFRDWLRMGSVYAIERDPLINPGWKNTIPEMYLKELDAFVDHIMWEEEGDWSQFLSADFTFLNDDLATLYGLPAPGSDDELIQVYNPERHFGLFSLGGFLASSARADETAPILRGVFVMQNLFCVNIEAPTETDVTSMRPQADPHATNRQRWETLTSPPDCMSCHRILNPAGFVFENFDQVGRWRSHDKNDLELNTQVELFATDIDGPYADLGSLTQGFIMSERVTECAVVNWANFSYGRQIEYFEDAHTDEDLEKNDYCHLQTAKQQFVNNGTSIKALLIGLTQTDAFLYKRAAE